MLTTTQETVMDLARRHGRVYRDGSHVYVITAGGSYIRQRINDPQWIDLLRRKLLVFVEEKDGRDPRYEPRVATDSERIMIRLREVERLEAAVAEYRAAYDEASTMECWGTKIPDEVRRLTMGRMEQAAETCREKLAEVWNS
jgi:hypothetical protein